MVMMYETLFLAFVALVAPLFGKLAGYELHRKPFEFVACSGLFFLLTVAFGVLPFEHTFLSGVWYVASVISYFIGWFTLFIGTFWALYDVIRIPEAHEHR
ncbi:MAG: hypothetical protein AB1473_19970 [Thermodesulfobacteriota bacterium]